MSTTTILATTAAVNASAAANSGSAAPAIWMLMMFVLAIPWNVAIYKWPDYFWQATNALAWSGALAFMFLTGAPQWILIFSTIYAAIAIPLSFKLKGI